MRELNIEEMQETSGGAYFLIGLAARKLIQAGWDFEHANASR